MTSGDIVTVKLFSDARPGAGAAFLVLAAFLLSFLAIRTSARLTRSVSWWPGGVQTEGGVHLHHLVWGICGMMGFGFLAFALPLQSPWWHLTAIGFGVGAGFTIDEFALWVRLQDVYWSEEGRTSFEAVVVATAFGALVLTGTRPFGLDEPLSIAASAVSVAVVVALVLVCIAKGRILLGVVGIFVPLVAIVGAARLGHPQSLWARRRYTGPKLERCRARFASARTERLERRVGDLVAGRPTQDP